MRRLFATMIPLSLASCAGTFDQGETRDGYFGTIQAIEKETGGRIGISLIDSRGEDLGSYNANNRFAMCSTFKVALAAMMLSADEAGELSLDDRIAFGPGDILGYAPIVEAYASRGSMTVRDLARAAVTHSDNSAANLLLARIGGPQGYTQRLRRWDDRVTRLDRNEPTLNENAVGEARDTSTPYAMADMMRRLVAGDLLKPRNRMTLIRWLDGSVTGKNRIRAGLPDGWQGGNKTGTCGYPDAFSYNDIAYVRSPNGNSYALAIYLDRPTVGTAAAEAAIARMTVAMLDGLE